MEVDIHNYKKKLERKLELIRKSKIDKENKSDILKFYRNCIAEGLGIPRIEKLLCHLYYLSLMFKKSFRKAKKEDIVKLVEKIETNEKWSSWTKHDYKMALKKFYKWINGGEDYPEQVRWIKLRVKNNNRLPQELLTEEDIKKLAETADNPRDRALVLVLYESGCRVGELLSLRIKNIQFDEYGAVLLVSGKTGDRRIRVIASSSTLASWLDNHPYKNNPESFVWVTKFHRAKNKKSSYELLNYAGFAKMLRVLAKRADIKKKVNPHAFRHARATHLAKHLTESQLKEMFGWTQSSKMVSIYVHMSGRDVDDALLKLHGLKQEEKENKILKLVRCRRCQESNDSVSQFCRRCGSPLELETALAVDEQRKNYDKSMMKLLVLITKKLSEKDPELKEEIKKGFSKWVNSKELDYLFKSD